jgi:hypothetical protein
MANPAIVYGVIDEWYCDLMGSNGKPGSELWATMMRTELVSEIARRWARETGYPKQCMPWNDAFIALLVTKKRKEPDKPLQRMEIRRRKHQQSLDLDGT